MKESSSPFSTSSLGSSSDSSSSSNGSSSRNDSTLAKKKPSWKNDALSAWVQERVGFQPFPESEFAQGGMVSLVDGNTRMLDFWASSSEREKENMLALSASSVRQFSREAMYQLARTDPRLCSWTVQIPSKTYIEWQAAVYRVMNATCAERWKHDRDCSQHHESSSFCSMPTPASLDSNSWSSKFATGKKEEKPRSPASQTLLSLSRKHALVLLLEDNVESLAVLLLLKGQIKSAFEAHKAYAKLVNLLFLVAWEFDTVPLIFRCSMAGVALLLQTRWYGNLPLLRNSSEGINWVVQQVFSSSVLQPEYIEWKSDAFVSAVFLLLMAHDGSIPEYWVFLALGLFVIPYIFCGLESIPRRRSQTSDVAKARKMAIKINKVTLVYFGWSSSWARFTIAFLTFFPILFSLFASLAISVGYSISILMPNSFWIMKNVPYTQVNEGQGFQNKSRDAYTSRDEDCDMKEACSGSESDLDFDTFTNSEDEESYLSDGSLSTDEKLFVDATTNLGEQDDIGVCGTYEELSSNIFHKQVDENTAKEELGKLSAHSYQLLEADSASL